jgi:hypothetical protein
MDSFSLKKLNEKEGKQKYRFEVSIMFPALEHLDAEIEINPILEMIREDINISAKRV